MCIRDRYHIDLQDIEYLHWWKFKALLRTLSSDLEFSKIIDVYKRQLKTCPGNSQKFVDTL